MDFENFAKLWPHQLDLLSGPLLEGDDDDDDNMGNPISNELVSLKNAHNLSESSTASDFHDDLDRDELRNEVHNKNCVPLKSTIRTFCVSTTNSCASVKKTGLGMVVYVGRKHGVRPDSDEEVDIETVEEELNGSPTRSSALSYRAFSRQMLNVVEDKEILHEVPNVIFANDTGRETGLCCSSSENARNLEVKRSVTVDEGQNKLLHRASTPLLRDLSTEALSVLESKEILHEVPNVVFNGTEKSTSGCKNSCDSIQKNGRNYDTAVLQASDVDSLLEQFEATEGITSQEPLKSTSPVPEDNTVSVDGNSAHSSPVGKKDVSPYIIQKIKMSSAARKGPILIPPSHQPKSRTRSNNQSYTESRKACRSSSVSFPSNKECSSRNKSVKYSFTLDHDHDYCTSSVSRSVGEKTEDVLSVEAQKGCERNISLVKSCLLLDKYSSCEPVDSTSVKQQSEGDYFIPDAEFEVEIAGNHVDVAECESVNMPILNCRSNICVNISEASSSVKSESHIDNGIKSFTNSDQTTPIVTPTKSLMPAPQEKDNLSSTSVHCLKIDTSGSVLSPDRIAKASTRSPVQPNSNCISPCGKRKRDINLKDSVSEPSKKCCIAQASNIHCSPRTQCDEKIDDLFWKKTRSPCVDNNGRPFWKSEKQKQIEERRVVYVGKLPEGLKVNDLRECFVRFGPIQDISIHFRESGDNYGFVTFFNRSDAYEVVERGKFDPKLRRFDLCFGGRRQFCRTRYSDLDSVDDGPFSKSLGETDFDTLLQKAKAGSQHVKHGTSTS